MTKHPLTDKIIREELITRDKYDRRLRDGIANCYKENMRAAADWQLDKVLEWLNENLSNYTDDTYLGDCYPLHMLERHLKEAMRPQKEQLQQEGNS